MEYAIVRTVRPKASETPSNLIPTCRNPAAMTTAEPQPANASPNVPTASAIYLLIWFIGCSSPFAQEHAKTKSPSNIMARWRMSAYSLDSS